MQRFSGMAIMAGLVLISTAATAKAISAGDEPGRIEQRFVSPPVAKAKLAIREGLESTMPPDQAGKISLKIRSIKFEGNSVVDSSALRALAQGMIGKTVTLRDVFKLAADVTSAYGDEGYTLSRAIVPPQELDPKGATITIRIIEGYVDDVKWPSSLDRYRDLFSDYAGKIKAERPIRVTTIERYLLLANDLPGLTFSSRLTPSASNPAASTLVVSLDKEKHVSASLGLDNRGTEGSGPYQAQAQTVFANVLGLHEKLSLGYTIAGPQVNSTTPELNYFSSGYEQVLTSEGLKFDLTGNASWGSPGTADLLLLNYKTQSLNISTSLVYPFIRTRDTNLNGVIAFDWKDSQSWILGFPQNEDRLRIIRAELSFDHADASKGINQIIFSASHGFDGLGSTQNGNPLASRSNGQVDFFKATLQASRLQDFGNQWSGLILASGQIAGGPLLSSQECGYGGTSIGRGFEPSVISGDDCFSALGELRYDISTEAMGLKKLQPYAFADYGSIWNIDPPIGTAAHDSAASVGAGIRFGWANFDADLQATYQIVSPTSVTVSNRVGVFFNLSARF